MERTSSKPIFIDHTRTALYLDLLTFIQSLACGFLTYITVIYIFYSYIFY
mgnify:CR=1 FL=1